jgi:hypothetical protein
MNLTKLKNVQKLSPSQKLSYRFVGGKKMASLSQSSMGRQPNIKEISNRLYSNFSYSKPTEEQRNEILMSNSAAI